MRFLSTLAFLLTALTTFGQQPLPSPIPAHPRLIAAGGDWDRLRSQVQTDSFSALLFTKMEAYAKKTLEEPPAERILVGRRMLGTSRMVLQRVAVLAMVAQITGNPAYVDRAVQEMRAAARFSDWHPEHYLDTAEMCMAMAIGYDWLYDKLSPEDRKEIETALLEKGIRTSMDPASPNTRWITATNNWNQVCHAGISAAAIALADLHPDLAANVLNRAIQNVPTAGKAYAPDGVFPEGPMYWHYATAYHVLLVAALDRFCGHAYGLDTLPGFAQTPTFMAEVTSPTGAMFDFSDSREQHDWNVPIFWFARRYSQAQWVRPEIEHAEALLADYGKDPTKGEPIFRLLPFVLLWHVPALPSRQNAEPLQWMGRGETAVAAHRSAWNDSSASCVAIKAGSPSFSHAHMDAGSFVLDSDGVRWALDLGLENYGRIEGLKINLWDQSQEGQRWQLFRLGAEGHNILRFNGGQQNVKASATFVRFENKGAQGGSVLDLGPLYAGQAAAVHRGVRLLPSKAILFQDEWTAREQPLEATWQFLTRAQVNIQPGAVELRQDGKTLTLQILEPASATVEVKTAAELQKPFDTDNPGVSRIVIKTHTAASSNGTFRILAIPGSCTPRPSVPASEALLSWPSAL